MELGMTVKAVNFDGADDSNGTFIVPKTVFSSTMRFVLEVGLEGTGHHVVGEVLDHVIERNSNLERFTGHPIDGSLFAINYYMGQTVQHYNTTLERSRKTMRELAQRGETLLFPGTVVYTHDSGRYHSYPSGLGPYKALRYLDLRLFAEVAEEEMVDLRLVYLRRSVKDTLVANTIHRNFRT